MNPVTPTTELEAVNLMLGYINEAPVNSLTNPQTPDASIAANILRETTRAVQTRGWSFNTEINYPLTRNGSGNIVIPSNTSRITFNAYSDVDPVIRGKMVYDRKSRSFLFTRDLTASRMIVLLAFDQMPESARHYVALKAARVFVDRTLGSTEQHGLTEAEEVVALADFLNDESETDDINFFNNQSVAPTIIRRPMQPWLG